ncbi:MAG: hypothetical protein GX817_06125 [Elusimicrobia bacterium]|nr:hypothetical protein [Elusimicrobiota bacterium]
MNNRKLVEYAMKRTRILKMPRRSLSTFGITNIDYYMLSRVDEQTRVREGRVISSRPEIIKPAEFTELFEGFGEDGEDYGKEIFELFGKNPRILNYRFKNEARSVSDTTSSLREVYDKLKEKTSGNEAPLSAIIEGMDSAWQISVMKFIVDMTLKSASENISDLEDKGMFPDEHGVPQNVRNRIEYLFAEAEKNPEAINKIGSFLNEMNLFRDYEDRFFRLLKKKK